MSDSRADKKCDAGSGETRGRSREGERAGAAFGRILFRQPERVHREVCAAESQEKKTHKKPRKRVRVQIEHMAESEKNKNKHASEKQNHGSAATEALGERWNDQATENRCGGEKHGAVRCKANRLHASEMLARRDIGDGRGNVHRPRPQAYD